MDKKKSKASEETRGKVLSAALQLFRERGFEKTTMREIATAADVATGAAYYYFDSKDAIVMAFYQQAQTEMAPSIAAAVEGVKTLEAKIRVLIEAKLNYFAGNRHLLKALTSHIDPKAPLSPFSQETAPIRDADIQRFRDALANQDIPADLLPVLPQVLWMYQMGMILFWVLDESDGQSCTKSLLDRSLKLVSRAIKIASLPLTRPLRRHVVELVEIVQG